MIPVGLNLDGIMTYKIIGIVTNPKENMQSFYNYPSVDPKYSMRHSICSKPVFMRHSAR